MAPRQKNLKQRLAMWAAGQALPEASVLRPHIRALKMGLVAAIIAGVLVAATACMGLFGFYLYLMSVGLQVGTALFSTVILSLLVAVLAIKYAGRQFEEVTQVTDSVRAFPKAEVSDTVDTAMELCAGAVRSFLDGLKSPPPRASNVDIQQYQAKIDRCLREIEMLESELESPRNIPSNGQFEHRY